MNRLWLRCLLYVALLTLSACSYFSHNLIAPDVTIAALRMGPGEGLYQTVLIDLVITNPNKIDLELDAISYRVRLQGREIVNGTSREPLYVSAGGNTRYTVPASINMLNSVGFLRDILRKSRDSVRYDLEATLEPKGMFAPPITVRKSDAISLTQ